MSDDSASELMRSEPRYSGTIYQRDSTLHPQLNLLDADTLQIDRGSRGRGIWGIPFLGIGIFILMVAMPARDELFGGIWIVKLVMGIAFTAVGLALLFGRYRVVIDRRRSSAVQSWGIVIPMYSKHRDLTDYDTVTLSYEPGDSGSADTHHVVLRSSNAILPLYDAKEYGGTYPVAVYIARFLSLMLEDVTSGTLSRVDADELGTTFVERLHARRPGRQRVAQPFEMRSRIERGKEKIVITIAGQPFSLWRHLPAFIPLAIALHLGWAYLDALKDIPDKLKPYVYGLLAMPLVIWPVLSLVGGLMRARLGYSCLTVTPDRLTLATRGVVRTTTRQIELSSVTDLTCDQAESRRPAALDSLDGMSRGQYPDQPLPSGMLTVADRITRWLSSLFPNKGIVIKSTSGIYTFGAGLSPVETEYLCQQVLEWIRMRGK